MNIRCGQYQFWIQRFSEFLLRVCMLASTKAASGAKLDRRDWNLLVIASAKEPLSPVQLQKSLFLVGEQLKAKVSDYYNFEPYHYGPFDRSVYDDTADLALAGLVKPVPGRGRWNEYSITAKGLQQAKHVRASVGDQTADFVGVLVEWVQSQTFASLLRSVYASYPKFKVNSVFQD